MTLTPPPAPPRAQMTRISTVPVLNQLTVQALWKVLSSIAKLTTIIVALGLKLLAQSGMMSYMV